MTPAQTTPWRGSLLPLGCAAAAKPDNAACLETCRGLLLRPAGASSLATGVSVEPNIQPNATHCGSGLARESGGSACISTECIPASKPPTSNLGCSQILHPTQFPCGSELARDENDTVPEPNNPPASPKSLPPTAPTYTPLSSYVSLRLCLQLRQNPPACAPCPWVLLSSCHCPSVVGFSSPGNTRRLHRSHQSGICLHSMVAVRMAPSGAPGFVYFTGLLTCAQLPPFRLVARRLRPY